MKRINALTIVSIVFLIGVLYSLKSELDLKKIQEGSYRVEVKIIDVPKDCEQGSYRSKPYFRFMHNGEIHVKDISNDYCDEIINNETIVLKTNKEYSSFLFENEDVSSDIGACLAIIAVTVVIFFISLKKEEDRNFTWQLQKKEKTITT